MNAKDAKALRVISEMANTNPFSVRRFELENKILGKDFSPESSIAWNRREDKAGAELRPNVKLISQKAVAVVDRILQAKEEGKQGVPSELRQEYWDVATYILLYRHITPLHYGDFWGKLKSQRKVVAGAWQKFLVDYCRLFGVDESYSLDPKAAAHLFACLAQVHRAFFHIFDFILGESLPVTRLRERVWESIFSCDLARYHRSLFDRMRDLSTLVTGPSGTGKELVARAIGLSQYIPFDCETEQFVGDHQEAFFPLNLSALSPTLIESELFGHHRGAFTGAVEERIGWLESCSPHGAVFLDEIGELDAVMQVKLLRVVQQRTYSRLGETKERRFHGKIISATNRNLFDEINAGRFREDFYFRLCSDRIVTPSLREQLDDRPSDIRWFVLSISRRISGGHDAELLADEAKEWIENNLGADYPWAGNIRELEQCVSSIMLRREYQPVRSIRRNRKGGSEARNVESGVPEWLKPVAKCQVNADQLLRRYCTRVYAELGSYEKTAALLQLDRRTVKSKVDEVLLAELRAIV